MLSASWRLRLNKANTDLISLIEVAGFPVEIVRKPIKNLHVGVYPPDGRIRVAAPGAVSQGAVRVAILTRLPWIKRQKRSFESQARETKRQYVSGETHFVFGKPHRLQVVNGSLRHQMEIAPDRLIMHVPQASTPEKRAGYARSWQRRILREKATPRVEKWATSLNQSVPEWGIRRMKTKWGSCNPDSGQVWINLELFKKPLVCLDYVVFHELAHFISPKHDEKFVAVLDQFMPTWRQIRADLNSLPLGYEQSFEKY